MSRDEFERLNIESNLQNDMRLSLVRDKCGGKYNRVIKIWSVCYLLRIIALDND